MNDSFRLFLETLKRPLHEIGMSNDIQDHGSVEESDQVYNQARQDVRKVFEEASAENRELFGLLFGSTTEFDRYSWSRPFDYIDLLLAGNPEISVARLRERIPRFYERIANLQRVSAAFEEVLRFEYTNPVCEPSLLKGFLTLLARLCDPPGWHYETIDGVFTSFHFTLAGDGLTVQARDRKSEYNMLVHDVWVHCVHPIKDRRVSIRMVSLGGSAGRKIANELNQELEKHAWSAIAANDAP